MCRVFLSLVAVSFLLLAAPSIEAQSPELPVPNLVVKDADGKVMAQVVGFYREVDDNDYWPMVVIDVQGTPAILVFQPFGLIDRASFEILGGGSVYFSGPDCTGTPYVNRVGEDWLEAAIGTQFGVGGPDAMTGEYKLYRSTTTTFIIADYYSFYRKDGSGCLTSSGQAWDDPLLPAEEVIPNPLEGFHGPTAANPERVLTLSGGDRLNQTTP